VRLGRRAVHFDDGDVQRFIEQRGTVA
jgi:predicted DNA-binding transcriptional regulator AlpA